MALKEKNRVATGWRRTVTYVAVAAAVHILLFLLFPSLFAHHAIPERKKVQMLSLAPYTRAQRAVPPPTSPKDPSKKALEEERKKKQQAELKGQVVDLPPSPDSKAPENADYLSEHNTHTEHETRSRHQSADYQNVMNEPTVAHKTDTSAAKTPRDAAGLEIGPERPSKERQKKTQGQAGALEIPTIKQHDRLALRFDSSLGEFKNESERQKINGNSDRLKLADGAPSEQPSAPGSAPKQGLTMADLVPQVGVLARLNGGPSNDFLENIDEGEGTFLNSREFKYASFFNRLKRGVSQHWRPLAEYQRRDPTGNIYGSRSRVTVLSITLNPDGSLKEAEVKRSSGVEFLDREAIAAFKRAEPFPNPPKGLADGSGIIIFPFGFHIDFNSRGGGGVEAPF